MKNKTVITLTLLATLGVAGSAFAGSPFPNKWSYSGTKRTNNNAVLSGTAYSDRQNRTIMGEVISVNAEKGVFVVEDKRDGITATVLTDSQTIVSLHPGQMVTVKLRSGSSIAESVMVGSSAKNNAVPVGMVSYNKEGGIQTQTIVGVVTSVNAEKGVFVVEDKRDGITATVLTDSQTIVSLHPGQTVRVKLQSGSPVAVSVAAGM